MSIHRQYASGRPQTLSPGAVVNPSGGFTTAPVTLWVAGQLRNFAGANRPSPMTQVTIPAGGNIVFTFNATDHHRPGERWERYQILAAATNDIGTAVPIATIEAQYSGLAPTGLPASVTLDRDSHFLLAPTVADPAALPSGVNLVDGMTRGIASLGLFFQYRALSPYSPNGTSIIAAATGNWIQVLTPFANITDTFAAGGSDADLDLVTTMPYPYEPDGSESSRIAYWLRNNNPLASGALVQQGAGVNIRVYVDGQDRSQAMDGNLTIDFAGYSNADDGSLINGFPNEGEASYKFGKNSFVLPQDLEPQQSVFFFAFAELQAWQVDGIIPASAKVTIRPDFFAQTGAYNPAGIFLGDAIASDLDLCRIVPDSGLVARVLPGSGVVSNRSFSRVGTRLAPGLQSDLAEQRISIDSNGSVGVVPIGIPITNSATLRGRVGTTQGLSAPFSAAPFVLVSAAAIDIEVTHPYSALTSNGIIRPDYPDVIAGNALGEFNPPTVRIFLQRQSDSEIRFFDTSVVQGESQIITIDNWSAGTIAGSLPGDPAETFSLFGVIGITPSVGGIGNLIADTYTVEACYAYDGNQITSINHSDFDAIAEISVPLSQVIANLSFWGRPTSTIETLRSEPITGVPNGQTRVVINFGGTPFHVVYSSASIAPDDGVGVFKPDLVAPIDAGRWLRTGGSGSGTTSDRVSLTGDLVLTAGSPDKIDFEPDLPGHSVQLPSLADDSSKSFVLYNLTLSECLLLDFDGTPIQVWGGANSEKIAIADFIKDRWIVHFQSFTFIS